MLHDRHVLDEISGASTAKALIHFDMAVVRKFLLLESLHPFWSSGMCDCTSDGFSLSECNMCIHCSMQNHAGTTRLCP